MVTLEELEADYQNAITAGAPAFMLDQKADEVARKKFADDPDALNKYFVRARLQRFRHRTSEDVQFAIGTGLVSKADEVLWADFESILSDVEIDNPQFYKLQPKDQRKLVKEAAEEYAKTLNPPVVSPFGRVGEQQQEEQNAA